MNNRFKFRVWNLNKKEYEPDLDDRGGAYLWNTGQIDFPHKAPSGIYVIEQCTGLKDKNGKLIYEGDIVHYEYAPKDKCAWQYDFIGLITFKSTGFHIAPLKSGGLSAWLVATPGADEQNSHKLFEIIGNVHERTDQ